MQVAMLALSFQLGFAATPATFQRSAADDAADSLRDLRAARSAQASSSKPSNGGSSPCPAPGATRRCCVKIGRAHV